jgi:hypothetical protein
MPNVAAPHFNPKIESLFQSLARNCEELWIRAHLNYAEFEDTALQKALRVVADYPDQDRRVWETMEVSFDEAELQLLERDAEAFSFVSYSTVFSNLLSDDANHASVD